MRTATLWALSIAVFFDVSVAEARQSEIEIGAGAGYARSLHADLDFGAPTISVMARFHAAGPLVFEPQVGYWRHEERQTFGIGGNVTTTESTRAFIGVTGSVLAVSSSASPVRAYAGGGLGIYTFKRTYRQSGSATFPDSATSSSSGTLGAQVLGGLDVRAASRLKLYGEFRFEVQSLDDPGSSAYRIIGGAAVRVK